MHAHAHLNTLEIRRTHHHVLTLIQEQTFESQSKITPEILFSTLTQRLNNLASQQEEYISFQSQETVVEDEPQLLSPPKVRNIT
jgi:hypothetical protein